MSLYNFLHGFNPLSDLLLQMLGLTRNDVGRYRDIHIEKENDKYFIVVYTRNGGGNRECWEQEEDSENDCKCPGCIITRHLPKHPNYICDYDSELDSTYASVKFSVPNRHIEYVEYLYTLTSDKPTPDEKMKILLAKLEKGDTSDPAIQEVSIIMKEALDQIFANLDKHKDRE